MKKNIKLIIAIVLISIISFLGYSISKKISYKKEVTERIKTIPKFSFLSLNNVDFTQNNLAINNNKLFVYFNSECEYCQSEATQISQNLEEFKETQLIFISFEPLEGIKEFAKTYNLLDKENVIFLHDSKLEFSEIFDAKSIPFLLLYSKDNKLIEKYKGATKIENITKFLN